VTYDELLSRARALYVDEKRVLKRAELDKAVRALSADARLGAFLLLLETRKQAYVGDIAQQKMAAHHGTLAHCAGSLDALLKQEATLRELLANVPLPPRSQPPQED